MAVTILSAVIIFGLLIIMHEFGHFFAAKSVGIKVNEFAVGMGPVLYKKKKGETEYSLRAFPIGGFVKMEGEDEESDDERSFNQKPAWAKMLVAVAGSFMNFIFAMLLIMVIVYFSGFATVYVGQLIGNSPAEAAGILPGDKIVRIEGEKISRWEDISAVISKTDGSRISVEVERDGKVVEIDCGVTTDESGRRMIGIVPKFERNLPASVKTGFINTFLAVGKMLEYLADLLTGSASTQDVVGPIGIVHIVGEAAKTGQILNLIALTAMISLNLAVLNLLPIPALDGGRILFIAAQAVIGRKLDPEKEGFIHFIGFVFLMAIMVLVMFKDIKNFIVPWISRWF